MRARCAAIGALAITVMVFAPRADGRGHPADPINDSLEPLGYAPFWRMDLHLDANNKVRSTVLFDQDVYVFTEHGQLFAIERRTGALLWARLLEPWSVVSRNPTLASGSGGAGQVLIVDRRRLYRLDRVSGDSINRIDLDFAPSSSAAADPWSAYLGSISGEVIALDWPANPCCPAVERWHVAVNGLVETAPVLTSDGRLFVVSDRGTVQCANPRTKALVWSIDLHADVAGGILVDGGGVYVSTRAQHLYDLDARNGAIRHRYQFPGPLFARPIIADGVLFQECLEEGLFAFDPSTHRLLWDVPQAKRWIAASGDRVLLEGEPGTLLSVTKDTGRIVSEVQLPRFDRYFVPANPWDSDILLVNETGRITCARPRGSDRGMRSSDHLSGSNSSGELRSSDSVGR